MQGWLIVNNFVNSKKAHTLRGMLIAAAQKQGISLKQVPTGSLNAPVGGSFGPLPDFGIFWDKDIALAKRLEQAGLRLFNSSAAIENCDNKILTYMALAKAGVAFPETYCAPKTYPAIGYSNTAFVKQACSSLGFPLIIKEAYGSFGQQVYLAKSLAAALKIVAAMEARPFVMQSFVKESSGRDIRINVVGGRVVASIYRYNNKDFRSNISNGGSMRPIEPTPEQQALALRAAKALELDFAGVDVLVDNEGKPTICEVNSNPHFKSTYDCTGVDMSEHIISYIKETL